MALIRLARHNLRQSAGSLRPVPLIAAMPGFGLLAAPSIAFRGSQISGAAKTVASQIGSVRQLTGSGGYVTMPASASTRPWTMLAYGVLRSSGASAIVTMAESPGAATYDRSLLIGTSGLLTGMLYDGVPRTATAGTVSVGVPFVAAAVCTGTTITAYLNGTPGTSTATSNAGYTGYTSPELVCGYGGGANGVDGGSATLSSSVDLSYAILLDGMALPASFLQRVGAEGRLLFRQRRIWVPVSAGGGTSVSAGAGALSVDGQAPTVAQSANQSLTAGAGSVTLQGFAPTVAQSQSVAPGAGPLTISGFAPAVSQSASGAVAPDAGAVTLTGYAPSIAQPQTAAPGGGALTFTGYAPDVQQASGVLPGAGSITITGQAPTVAQTAAQSVAPGTGPLSITGYAPDIAQSGQPQAPSGGVIFGRPPWAKRYVVQHGRRVLVFGTEAAALEAQAAIDKARAIRATATAAPSNRARRRVEKTARGVIAGALASIPPVDSFTADQLQALANTYASSDTLAELQRLRDFEQMARMWEDLRAEEDDIAAFMELM